MRGAVPHRLVLAGRVANLPALETTYLNGLGDRVRFAGYVPDADLPPLLKNAELFVFPALYEGFGLPVLEAQEQGVPVACSRVASLPEVAEDSAFFFDPLRPEVMAGAITRCLTDAPLREELVRKGRANVRRFSWAQAASITRDVYRRVLGLPPPGAPGDAPSPAGPPRV